MKKNGFVGGKFDIGELLSERIGAEVGLLTSALGHTDREYVRESGAREESYRGA